MRLLGPASLGSFSWLVLARRCWLRFWGDFARLGLTGRCWLCLSSGCAEPWLSRRCWRSVLAAFAVAFASFLAMRSSSVLATTANLWRHSRSCRPLRAPALASGAGLLRNLTITYPLLYCSGDLPLLRARGLPRGLAFSCPSLCCSGGLPLLRVRASIGFRPFPDLLLASLARPCFGRGSLTWPDLSLSIT